MGMSCTELMRWPVWATKRDRDIKLSTGHRKHVRSVVDHLIERDKRKAERHEFDDRPQADHRRADAEPGETVLADGCVDDPFRAEALEQALAYFISALIFGDFFAHQKDIRIALQFFRERFVECLPISDFSHRFAPAA